MRNNTVHEEDTNAKNSIDGKDAVVAYALLDDSFRDGNSASSSPSSSSSLYLPYRPASTTTAAEDDIVSLWYDHYAQMFPSSRYVKRQQQQQQRLLLQQEQRQELEKIRHGKSSRRGGDLLRLPSFIGKWMGGSRFSTTTAAAAATSYFGEGNCDEDANNDDDKDDDINDYNSAICHHPTQTKSNIIFDEIIPPREATSFHRFHLVSERRALSIGTTSMASSAFVAISENNHDTDSNRNNMHNGWNNVAIPVRPCIMRTRIAANTDGTSNTTTSTTDTTTTRPIPHFCIVGYGQIAELNPSTPSSSSLYNDNSSSSGQCDEPRRGEITISSPSSLIPIHSKILLTSDWQRLSNSSSLPLSSPVSRSSMPHHDPGYIRAASIGRNCLIVSWGMLRNEEEEEDSTEDEIMFYRKRTDQTNPQQQHHQHKKRHQMQQQNDASASTATMMAATTTPIIGWEAVAVAFPSETVIRDALQNITPRTLQPTTDEKDIKKTEGDEDQHLRRLRDCRSLIVTDLIPMTIGNDIVLAVSRLGGYVELLPIPNWVWEEAPMNLSAASSTTTERRWRQKDEKKKKQKKKGLTSRIPNLTALSKITVFSTARYHSDVVSMDAYRCVESSSGNSCRAEVILAACGQHQRHRTREEEVSSHTAAFTSVSLWGLSIARHSSSSSSPTFPILGVSHLGHATLENVGADVSSFLSDSAAERWATNHRDCDEDDETNCNEYPPPSKRRKKITLKEKIPLLTSTATAPMVSLRFSPPCQKAESDDSRKVDRVLLAALDYNGGVSVFDCTEACKTATDSRVHGDVLPPFDGDILFGASSVASNSLEDIVEMNKMRLLCSRESTMSIPSGGFRVKSSSHGMKVALASQIEWWPHESSITLATYATTVRRRKNFVEIPAKRTSIVRIQSWSSSAGSERSQRLAPESPKDVLYVATSSNDGASSISLLPMIPQHPSLLNHETLSFLRLSTAIVPAPSSPSSCNRVLLHLSVCGIRKFTDPTEIMAALLRRGDTQKALDVSRRFGFRASAGRYRGDERLLNECQIDLWSTKRDPQALKLISDDAYVIHQATELANGNIRQHRLSLNDLLEIFSEALTRCEDGEGDKECSASQLRNAIRRLGTFNLVLNHVTAATADTTGLFYNGQAPSYAYSRRFLHLFHHEALYDIAARAASTSDANILTVIIARHPFSLQERMGLLDLIPFEVHIRLYEHLMPCYHDNMNRNDAMFLFRTHGNGVFLSYPQLFSHLSDSQLDRQQNNYNSVEEFPVDIFTDDTDREYIMRHLEGASSDDSDVVASPLLKEDVINWYLKRALHTHNKTGQILLVKEVCAAGLVRLGLGTFSDDGKFEISDMNVFSSSVAAGRLVYLYSASSLACLVSVAKMKDFMSCSQLSIESIADWKNRSFLSVIQLCSMELSDLFTCILENGSTHSIPLIHKYVAHLVDGSHCLEPMNNGALKCSVKNIDLVEKFGNDMAQQCLEKLKGLRGMRDANFTTKQDSQHLTIRLEESLAMCANFISFGRLHSESKLDRNNDNHIIFVDSIFRATLEVRGGEWDVMTDGVIGKLWSIFELISYTTVNEPDRSLSQDLLSDLNFRLATLQLCKKWHDHQAFPHELWRGHHDTRELCVTGLCVVSFICSGFCEMVARMSRPRHHCHDQTQEFGLLFDFISDVDEFDNRFFSAAIQQSGCLVKHVFSPLLHQHSFVMLNNILNVRQSWFNHDFMHSIVSSFIRDVSTSQDGMLQCWNKLGQWFPDLRVEVEYQQRMFDAREFMMNAMNLDEKLLASLFSVGHSSIELVHTLLSVCPQVILLGCEFWSDEIHAFSACTDAVVYFTSEIHASLNGASMEESIHVLPPMPGALVMQLASILGLGAPYELLVVKRCMVDGALKMSLGPAAVAICYSMLCDAAYSRRGDTVHNTIWTSRHESQVLNCVVALAKDQSSLDSSVKKEVCTFALRLFVAANSPDHRDIFDELRVTEYKLLAITTSHRDQSGYSRGARMDEASDFSVFQAAELVAREFMDHSQNSSNTISVLECENSFFDRSLNRLFHDVKKLSQIDLLQLLAFTGKKSVDNNESTMDKISEAILGWVVSEAFRVRSGSVSTTLPVDNIETMLNLGLSCLLECHEHGTSRIMSGTLNNFKSKAAFSKNRQRIPTSPSFQPDQTILQRLVDRGYTRNAARRAVMMTSNQSYSAALTWAVSHFQDADFDSPIYFLRFEGPSVCADQYLIDTVDKLLQTVQRIVKEKLSHAEVNKTPVPPASVKVSSSHHTSITLKERFVSKIPSPSSRASPLPFQDKSTALNDPLKGKTTPSPFTVQESYPLTTVGEVGGRIAMETPPPPMKVDRSLLSKPQPPPPNSADSSSIEGSLSSRASIKNQIKHGMTKFGTQKLSVEERNRLALEGRRLLDEARAKGGNIVAPPTEITTSSSNTFSKKV